jgi:large subunit ribosomal protein L5
MAETQTTEIPRLKARYREEIVPALRSEFDIANIMQVPGLTKIVVNMGVGEAARDSKLIEGAVKDLTAITGQKPLVTKARKSIAQFKLREGMPIGAHTTLRGDRMWEFLDRLLSLALPRIRDFRGLNPNQFDGRGNYTFGLTEQVMFHEIDQDRIDRSRGMDITVVTSATNDDEGRALLRQLGFPFKERWNGQDSPQGEGCPQAQVRGARLHPVPALRTAEGGLPQVRPLPHLPAADGAPRRAARGHQVQLVNGRGLPDHTRPRTRPRPTSPTTSKVGPEARNRSETTAREN